MPQLARPHILMRLAIGGLLVFTAMQAGQWSSSDTPTVAVADAHTLATPVSEAATTAGDVGRGRAGDLVSARKSTPTATAPEAVPATAPAPVPAPIVVSDPRQRYEPVARAAAARYGIDPNVFVRQITKESHWDVKAVSPAGALGIAQFMPSTAASLGVDPLDPIAALDAAAKLDRDLLNAFHGNYALMLAAYNAGPGSVRRYGGIPPFRETQNYVRLILGTDPL